MSAILKHLTDFTLAACLVRLAMAALLGGIIGYERERHGRAAGLRTHILVCIGSATAVIGGLYVAYQLGFSNDPLRAGAQVISGIGFLGAGTILTRNGDHVIGLTTAAGLCITLEPALRRAEQTAAELRTLEGVAFLIPDDDV